MPTSDKWRSRLRTASAIAALSLARLLVAFVPFGRWRSTLGAANAALSRADEARRSASHVERAAKLLPFATKCLPQAMALSWILRRRSIGHVVVFAVRPARTRGADEDLHAWVEVADQTIIGDLPGPWVETLRLGD